MMVYEVQNLLILNPSVFGQRNETVLTLGRNMNQQPLKPSVHDINENQHRRDYDTFIFDVLNLTQGERDGVYQAVVEFVETRLSKAKSLQGQ